MLTSPSGDWGVGWGWGLHTFKRFANITRSLFTISRNTAQRGGRTVSCTARKKESGVKTRLRYKTQDVVISTYSNDLGQIAEKDNAFIFCVRQPIAKELLNTEAFEFAAWCDLTLYVRSTCFVVEQLTITMYSSQRLSGLKPTARADLPPTAVSWARLMLGCHRLPTAQQQDKFFRQGSYHSFTLTGLSNISDSPLSIQNWVLCIVCSWQPGYTRIRELHQSFVKRSKSKSGEDDTRCTKAP